MELLWKEENITALAARVCASIELEGDIPLPEGRNCTALLATQSLLESCVCSCQQEGGIRIEGVVHLTLLCQDENGIFAFSSRASFSHLHGESASELRSCCALNAPNVKLCDGALHFDCSIDADLLLLKQDSIRVLQGIDGLPQNDLQCRNAVRSVYRRVQGETLRLRLREELAVPNIAEVLCAAGELQLRENASGEGALSGTLSLSLLCRDTQDRLFQSIEHVPFHTESGVFENGMETAVCTLSELSVRSVGEEFGILAAEAELCLEPFRLDSRRYELPVDAYAPSLPFMCNFSELCILGDAGTRAFRSSFDAQLQVPEGLPEIAAPIFCCAHPCVTDSRVENGRLYVEGILEVRAVYKSANGSCYAFTDEIPFAADDAAPGAQMQQLRVRALSRISGTGRAAQAQFCLCFSVSYYTCDTLRVVTGISECEKTPRAAGIVVLYAGAGETLFDIAKRYNVTVEALCALQSELKEPLEEGQRILMLV